MEREIYIYRNITNAIIKHYAFIIVYRNGYLIAIKPFVRLYENGI